MRKFGLVLLVGLLACVDGGEEVGFVENAVAPPGSDSSVVSHDIPATMAPGETRTVNVTMQNDGPDPVVNVWVPTDTRIIDRVPRNFGFPQQFVASNVAIGDTYTFTFNITAPTTPGMYDIDLQMHHRGYFGERLTLTIDVSAGTTPEYECTFLPGSSTIPTTMAPTDSTSVTIAVQNTGSTTWTTGSFDLYSTDSPVGFWNNVNSALTADTPMGGTATFTFNITAPATPGMYSFGRQMREIGGVGIFSGPPCVDVTIDVSGSPSFNAIVDSHDLPAIMAPSQVQAVNVTMENTGSSTWTAGTDFALNFTGDSFGVTRVFVDSDTAPGGTHTFSFNITAPATPGDYNNNWQMRKMNSPSAGFFGDELMQAVTVQAGSVSYDLASDAADRMFTGSRGAAQLANMAAGNWSGGGAVDLVVSERQTPPGFTPFRSAAGALHGYTGGGGFLSGSTSVPSGAAWSVVGAEINDRLGAVGGRLGVGDVTGDGVPDVAAGAHLADGVMNTRNACGEVFVISGGAGLTGTIDLAEMPLPAQVAARIIGEAADDNLRLLAVGDVAGGSQADLILGAPGNDAGGADAGAVYVVVGGAALTGEIDLAAPGGVTVYKLTGAAAGDQLGTSAAIGDFGGSGSNDLLIGAFNADPGGRSRAGEVYALFGPVSSDADMGSGFDARWQGDESNELLGKTLGVGNVSGGSRDDVIIGASQLDRSPNVQAGGLYITDAPIAAGTIDYSSTSADHIIFGADQFDLMGNSLAIGDVGANSRDDFLIAGSTADGPGNGRDRAGESVIIHGNGALPAVTDLRSTVIPVIVYGAAAADLMGHHAGATLIADLDGDGDNDVCIGSYRGGGADVPGRIDCFDHSSL